MGKKVNITKPKSQDRGEDSVKKKTENARTSTLKRCCLTTKDQAQTY